VNFDPHSVYDSATAILICGFVVIIAGDERQPTAGFTVYS
jgi:hypothetical protein